MRPAARFISIRSSREQTRTRPSVSAAISSSGANIRLAAQAGLELRGDTAEPHGLLETLGHRALEVAPPVFGSRRLVAADPRLDRLLVRHGRDRTLGPGRVRGVRLRR